MFGSFIRYIKRPDINEQTTGREAFQRYNGPAYAGINGSTGFTVKNQIRATAPGGIAVGPTHKLNDPTATGNNSATLKTEPLSKDNISLLFDNGASF